jgi:hypothetical protein
MQSFSVSERARLKELERRLREVEKLSTGNRGTRRGAPVSDRGDQLLHRPVVDRREESCGAARE